MSRADLMYDALRLRATHKENSTDIADEGWATRRWIFNYAGRFFLTNNAAGEMATKYGVQYEHKIIGGEHCYRLLGEGREPCGAPPDVPPFPEQPAAVAAHAAPAAEPLIPPLPGQLTLT